MDEDQDKQEKESSDATPPVGAKTRVDDDPLAGKMLDSRYLLKRRIGSGGFGVVYLASDEKMLSRRVVVKALLDQKIDNAWSVRKFKQEMEALARLDHPSIVGLLDTGQLSNGQPYIVMQYVDGVTLRSIITPEGIPFARAAHIIMQAGRALGAAHDHGILHRDLKPENLMLQTLGDGEEQVKIIDFGIAKVKNSLISFSTAGDLRAGTVAYMSPEQLDAGKLTPASDVYCLAVIAYEMLTGRRPTNPDSAYQLLEMQRAGVRLKPTDLRPSLPSAAESAILKALSFDPAERYQRARDFGDRLAAALLDDDEETRAAVQMQETVTMQEAETLSLETAHVLFADVVGYSKLLIDEQTECLKKLQQIVLATKECRRATQTKSLIRLPTGDGMALVFFGDPEAPLRCAIEISRALATVPNIGLRMGVHSGLVNQIADINTNMNVAGGGINIAQRIMDCGDSGHIMLSRRVADDLGQLARWSPFLHDLGTAEVKHGVKVHVFNLFGDDFGNSALPAKFASPSATRRYAKVPIIATVALAILVLMAIGLWFGLKPKAPVVIQPAGPETIAPAGPELSLTYWLTVQKVLNKKPLGPTFESSGQEAYGDGWMFQFNLSTAQAGALYLVNEGPDAGGRTEYDILFPTPANNGGVAQLNANQTVHTSRYQFVEHEGLEKFWIIWSARAIPELDAIFKDAASHQGVVDAAQIGTLQTYLKRYESAAPETKADKEKNRTVIKGRGEHLVKLIELSHRAY